MEPDRAHSGPDGGAVKTLRKALRLLEELARRQPAGVTDLARALRIPKSRASRFLSTLAAEGYAERLADERYVLGPRLVDLAGAAQVARLWVGGRK
ncbi:MAG: helix-turn-helix domain-containing protein [Planctomycetota bacterium]|nr:helix-turn-helix domain-containing protein [Planctomycetota bacterium]